MRIGSPVRLTGPLPDWLPAWLAEKCAGRVRCSFSFSEGERQALYLRKPETPSVWAERHRVVRLSSIPGRWRHIFAPYIAPLMDAARFPGIETVILCKGPQSAGSEAGFNLLGHAVDHAPGPAMVVFPDKDVAKDAVRERIMPMLEDSPRLRRYLTGAVGDESGIRVNLRHMSITMGWSGSPSRLSSRPIRTLILDELDKFQDSTKEASSEKLAEHRTTTWRGRRLIIKISTPTTENGPIWTAFTEEAGARFDWRVVCPACGTLQLMRFDNIRWPENIREPEVVLKDRLAVYQCGHCPAQWDDMSRDMAVRRGQWIERLSGLELFTHLKNHPQIKIGFHIPAWISHFKSLSDVAHAFLLYHKSGRLKDLKNFMNQYKAEPWTERHAERQEDAILSLCDDRPRGKVPGPVPRDSGEPVPRVAALVAGIDTQASYFRYVIRAFGYGDAEESWLIQCGTAQGFGSLDELLRQSVYTDAQGGEYRVRVAVIDAMGAPGRTKQVYAWAARRPWVMAYQGKQNLQGPPVAYSPIEFFPDVKGSKVKIPGGLLLRRVDTTFFKSDLAEKLTIAPGDPGCFHLHSSAGGLLTDYAREMCAEVFNPESLAWENPRQRANHFWDCEVMCLVGAWELGLRNKRPPALSGGAGAGKRPGPPAPPRMGKGLGVGEMIAAARG